MKNILKKWFKTEDAPAEATELQQASSTARVPVAMKKLASPNAARPFDAKTFDAARAVLGTRWQTEKATALESFGIYSFLVAAGTNAPIAASAFRLLTGVRPTKVNMLWRFPKRSSRGHLTRRKKKLARITVAKGVAVKFPEQAKQAK